TFSATPRSRTRCACAASASSARAGRCWQPTLTPQRTGASRLRPGYQKLLEDARHGEFDVVVAEALDRLSRDQEDGAGLYKQLGFAGVKLVTLAEGEISELHAGAVCGPHHPSRCTPGVGEDGLGLRELVRDLFEVGAVCHPASVLRAPNCTMR